MKIVISPDSFKDSIDAAGACAAISRGVRQVVPSAEIVMIPMADGGEGTVEALVSDTGGRRRTVEVCGPLGEPVQATYGILGSPMSDSDVDTNGPDTDMSVPDADVRCSDVDSERTAVIEMAQAAGLEQVPIGKRNPLYTTTYGLGQLIGDALEQGCRNFVIGIGGSATNDCGCGMAQALGVRFIDGAGREITEPMTGWLAGKVSAIELGGQAAAIKTGKPVAKIESGKPATDVRLSEQAAGLAESRFVVACDVNNPLLGQAGASRVYGPQKGAAPEAVERLEANLAHVIDIIEGVVNKKVRETPGAGAAGGLGAGLMAFLGARLERGVEIVMRQNRFADRIKGADLIITGEGRIDGSTACGKTIAGVAAAAQEQSIPVLALAGALGDDLDKVTAIGVTAVMDICPGPMRLDEAMRRGEELLTAAAERAMRMMLIPLPQLSHLRV